jgi:hypothetical protein
MSTKRKLGAERSPQFAFSAKGDRTCTTLATGLHLQRLRGHLEAIVFVAIAARFPLAKLNPLLHLQLYQQ